MCSLDYHAAQRQMAAQRVLQDEQPSHPVGIRVQHLSFSLFFFSSSIRLILESHDEICWSSTRSS